MVKSSFFWSRGPKHESQWDHIFLTQKIYKSFSINDVPLDSLLSPSSYVYITEINKESDNLSISLIQKLKTQRKKLSLRQDFEPVCYDRSHKNKVFGLNYMSKSWHFQVFAGEHTLGSRK